jgi:hypothetical protein
VTLVGTDATVDGVTLFLAAGAPVATGQDEERMLRVLREILDSPEAGILQLRAGVNRGPVFAGDLGAPTRRTYTAMGDTTNVAARIAARARPGELLATADVLARSGLEFDSEPLPAFTPKGKRDPKQSLRPCAARLAEITGGTVNFADNCIGEKVEKMVAGMETEQILLLEQSALAGGFGDLNLRLGSDRFARDRHPYSSRSEWRNCPWSRPHAAGSCHQ